MKLRVEIPRNKAELLELVKNVQAKHLADGATSQLNPLNWETLSPIIARAVANHEKALRLEREVAEAFEQRDLNIDVLNKLARDSRDILTGIYSHEMKTLGQWGFKVMENRTNKKKGSGGTPPEEPKA